MSRHKAHESDCGVLLCTHICTLKATCGARISLPEQSSSVLQPTLSITQLIVSIYAQAQSAAYNSLLLFTGTVPFTHASIMGLYNVIRTQPVSFPAKPSVSPAMKDLIAKMLCKDPVRRISLPQVMQHPWTTHGNNLPLLCRQVYTQLCTTKQ